MTSPWAIMAAHFLRRFRRSSTSKVNFSVLTKRWALILLSKLSENFTLSEKWINVYVNFGVHGPLRICAKGHIIQQHIDTQSV